MLVGWILLIVISILIITTNVLVHTVLAHSGKKITCRFHRNLPQYELVLVGELVTILPLPICVIQFQNHPYIHRQGAGIGESSHAKTGLTGASRQLTSRESLLQHRAQLVCLLTVSSLARGSLCIY